MGWKQWFKFAACAGWDEGLYEFLKDKKFEERLGEYYQEDKSEGKVSDTLEINKTKKRIITYVWKNY